MDKGVDQAVVGVEEPLTGSAAGMGQQEAGGGQVVLHVRGVRPLVWGAQRIGRRIGWEKALTGGGIQIGSRVCKRA